MLACPLFRVASLVVLICASAAAQNHRARIAVEGGGELPAKPLVTPQRKNTPVGGCDVLNVFNDGTIAYRVPGVQRDAEIPDGCRVTIRLPGYHTTDATLTDGSIVTLQRLGDREGSTVSFASLKAPREARKAYDRGLAASNRQKYEEAAKSFGIAVKAYPEFAQAWSDLGIVQVALKRNAEARASWEKAITAEPQFLKPYAQLARLAVAEGRYEDALEITIRGLEFNPVELPAIYFLNAVANFNLKHYDEAERAASATIAHDLKREIPMVESLLGSILGIQGHLDTAIDHFHKYLELAPNAADAGVIRQKIAELERRGMEMK